jgi:hypothetical protein
MIQDRKYYNSFSLLAIPSILVGYFTKDMVVGVGSHFFGTAIFVNNGNVKFV